MLSPTGIVTDSIPLNSISRPAKETVIHSQARLSYTARSDFNNNSKIPGVISRQALTSSTDSLKPSIKAGIPISRKALTLPTNRVTPSIETISTISRKALLSPTERLLPSKKVITIICNIVYCLLMK